MWKPAGRLDCVDLEHRFFLTRFYLKEDYEATLKRGPWFIGEHFLSIRPWEPNFRPESANVTSVAVWIRLNGLPIEYYNSEALLHIGKAIGNVLRVDTHTANEARGRFARICVQIDVDKPLVTAVLIGRFEQSVCYEGIQKLCFSCGRLGHRKETCPYTVRPASPAKEGMTVNDDEGRTCDTHVPHGPAEGMENSRVVHGNVAEAVQESTYGPWTVVARRRNVPKNQRSGGVQAVMDNGRLKQEQRKAEDEAKFNLSVGRKNLNDGLRRDFKRKLDSPKVLAQAQTTSPLNGLRQKGSNASQQFVPHKSAGLSDMGPGFAKMGPKASRGDELEGEGFKSKAQCSPSVKGKKVIARNIARNKNLNEGTGSSKNKFNLNYLTPKILSRDGADNDPSTLFSFTTTTNAEMDKLQRHKNCGITTRGECGNEREDGAGEGMVRSPVAGSQDDGGDAGKLEGLTTNFGSEGGTEVAVRSTQLHHGEGAVAVSDGGEHGEGKMEVEEEGGVNAIL